MLLRISLDQENVTFLDNFFLQISKWKLNSTKCSFYSLKLEAASGGPRCSGILPPPSSHCSCMRALNGPVQYESSSKCLSFADIRPTRQESSFLFCGECLARTVGFGAHYVWFSMFIEYGFNLSYREQLEGSLNSIQFPLSVGGA